MGVPMLADVPDRAWWWYRVEATEERWHGLAWQVALVFRVDRRGEPPVLCVSSPRRYGTLNVADATRFSWGPPCALPDAPGRVPTEADIPRSRWYESHGARWWWERITGSEIYGLTWAPVVVWRHHERGLVVSRPGDGGGAWPIRYTEEWGPPCDMPTEEVDHAAR